MTKEQIKIGKKVKYFSIFGVESTAKITEITSEPWECCGTTICKVNGVSGGVDIENLEEI